MILREAMTKVGERNRLDILPETLASRPRFRETALARSSRRCTM